MATVFYTGQPGPQAIQKLNELWGIATGTDAAVPTYTPRRILTINPAIGSITVDWSQCDEVRAQLAGDVTFIFFGAVDGQGCTMKLKQDAAGSRAVTFSSSVRYSEDVMSFTASSAASKSDRVGFIYDAGDAKYDFVSFIKGF